MAKHFDESVTATQLWYRDGRINRATNRPAHLCCSRAPSASRFGKGVILSSAWETQAAPERKLVETLRQWIGCTAYSLGTQMLQEHRSRVGERKASMSFPQVEDDLTNRRCSQNCKLLGSQHQAGKERLAIAWLKDVYFSQGLK